MKKLLIVTYVDFWRKGSGHRTRINSMVNYLKDKVKITVFFAGGKTENEEVLLNRILPGVNFEFAGSDEPLTFKEFGGKFEQFIQKKFFDFAVIEYIELSIILEHLPEKTITFLDTHDVVYSRIESFIKFNMTYDGIVLTKQEELEIYECYDYIILIQKRDFESIAKEIGAAHLLLIPHPPILKEKQIGKLVKNVGYIASAYSPNIDALKWFLNNVWEEIYKKHDVVLNIYGKVHQGFEQTQKITNNNIIFHGFVDDLEKIYWDLDIIVNPIRCGAGLKIKNVEALGYGIPLITTTHGASGMEDGASKAFLIADSPKEYVSAFEHLIENYSLRKQISRNAFTYAQSNFSEEKCYQDILQIIKQ